MATFITRNLSEADGPIVPPLKDDGSMWSWCMYYNGMWDVAYSDTMTELVAVLIHGYEDMSPEDQDVARIKYAIHAATVAQGSIIGSIEDATDALTPEQLTQAQHPKHTAPQGMSVWQSRVPFIALTTNYEPYSDARFPETDPDGLVVELDPTEEYSFLHGLSHIGFINVMSSS